MVAGSAGEAVFLSDVEFIAAVNKESACDKPDLPQNRYGMKAQVFMNKHFVCGGVPVITLMIRVSISMRSTMIVLYGQKIPRQSMKCIFFIARGVLNLRHGWLMLLMEASK